MLSMWWSETSYPLQMRQKKKLSLNTKDIVIFVHTYLEQVVGIQLFEESALKIEKDLEKELKH